MRRLKTGVQVTLQIAFGVIIVVVLVALGVAVAAGAVRLAWMALTALPFI